MKRYALASLVIAPILVVAGCSTAADPGSPQVRRSGESATDEPESSSGDQSDVGDEMVSPEIVDTVVIVPPDPSAGSSDESNMAAVQVMDPKVVFINRAGRTYTGSTRDDSANGASWIVRAQGKSSINFPPTRYSEAEWGQLLGYVRGYFQPYNVTIADRRPATGAYIELAIGDTTSEILGYSRNTGGVAPLGPCRALPNAVSFVFARLYDNPGYGGIKAAAQAVAHEIGHSLSLSHESLATDIMSYSNSKRAFENQASACGTTPNAEKCSCGTATQNSHQQLLTMTGPRGDAPPPPPPPPPQGDTKAPTVSIVAPGDTATLPADSTIEVSVDAADETSLAKVQLYWEYTNRTLECDASVAGVTCSKSGARTTWRLNVGSGARRFYAIATDTAGNRAQSAARTINLGSATPPPPPPVDAAPTVTVAAPAATDVLAPGGNVRFAAEVADDKGVSDVRAVWSYTGGSLEFVMKRTTGNMFEANATLSATAKPGVRGVVIQATDTAGQKTASQRVDIRVQ